jgi:SET domain-containing protein
MRINRLKVLDFGTMKGCVASENIKTNETIYEFTGKKIPFPTRTSIESIYGHVEDEMGQYLNHNCKPNSNLVNFMSKEWTGMKVVAIQNIDKGTEITFDYNCTEGELSNPFECNCCNKLIKGRNHVIASRTKL